MKEKKHATYSASGSERWLNCPGSIALSAKCDAPPESEYAREGTRAHECLEILLKNHKKKPAILEKMVADFPPDMVSHAFDAMFKILENHDNDSILLTETEVSLAFVKKGMFGTVDAAIINEFEWLRIYDFKYGSGVVVDPKDNTQLLYYALGLAHQYDYNFRGAILTIVQPRGVHQDGSVREWRIETEDLRAWAKKFKKGVEACEAPKAKLVTGDWCRWCPAKAICPAISSKSLKEAQADFSNDDPEAVMLPLPQAISVDRLGKTLSAIEKIELWIDAVKTTAFSIAQKGHKIPGWKLVPRRSTRKWTDEAKAKTDFMKLLGNEVLTIPDLLSPAQVEKTITRVIKPKSKMRPIALKLLADSVSDISSSETLVPESDSRNAVVKDWDEEFEEPKKLTRGKRGKS